MDAIDMIFHMLIDGGTGTGKTNAVLYMLKHLFQKTFQDGSQKPALFLLDPAGDASIDLVRSTPKRKWNRLTVLDPQYVTFGFNLLSLPEDLDPADRPEILQTQVEQFSVLLSDVFNTDATNAPRMMWIFKGGLYYLYTFTPNPTLWELYNIMLLFARKKPKEVEKLLSRRKLEVEVIRETVEAISKLPKDAYLGVMNRISNFVLPPSSITFRTFCARKSTIDLEKLMQPGRLTIFRLPSSLSAEFRRLFAAAVVMKLYFASLKKANRLERAGQPPENRTPAVLAADEFRDIAQMKILRTILSQSRKYRLYLWMVTQTLSEVPPELMSSIEGNVGAALAFRSSPDDGKRLAKLLHPQRPEAVEKLIPALEDYAAIARKRPVGGKPVDRPFRIIFPKLSHPIHKFAAALDYMKVEMEKIYGGAVGDRSLVYKEDLEEEMREAGECYLGGPVYWVPLAYLHSNGPTSFSDMARTFEDRCGWERRVLQIGLSALADSGKVEERPGPAQLRMGRDPGTGQAVYKEPETEDEKLRAREFYYSITPLAEQEFFEFTKATWAKSGRVGGPLHVRVMKSLLDKYWSQGYWCAFDRGDRKGEFPDILVTKPLIIYPKGKEGKPSARMSTDDWDEESVMPVEVEITPSKNPDQLRRNYTKDVEKHGKVRFVVATRRQVTDVVNVLMDKDRATFEVVYEPTGLPEDELERAIREEEALLLGGASASSPDAPKETRRVGAESPKSEENKAEATQAPPVAPLQKNELWVLAKVCRSGYPGREAVASSLKVTVRQVTRYLDALEERALLQRDGNGYRATEKGRSLVARAGWTWTIPDDPDDFKVDMSEL